MRTVKPSLGALTALLCAVTMTASASAAGFLSSTKEKLLATKVAVQIFVTSQGTMECSEAKITAGESSGSETSSLSVTTEYKECLFFGFVPTEFSPFEYTYLAGGEVHLKKLARLVAAGCEMSFPVQLFGTVKYDNVGKNIELLPAVTGIHYTASKCPSNGSFTNGTFKGNAEVMTASGTLSFMP